MRKKTDFPWSPCEGEGLDCEEGCGLGGLWFRGGKDVWVGVWWQIFKESAQMVSGGKFLYEEFGTKYLNFCVAIIIGCFT